MVYFIYKSKDCTVNGCVDKKCETVSGNYADYPNKWYLDENKCIKCNEDNEMHCAVNKCYTTEKKCIEWEDGYYFKENEWMLWL